MTTRANLYVDQGIDFSITLDLFDAGGSDFEVADQEFFCSVRKLYSSSIAFEANTFVDTSDNDINSLELSIPASTTRNVEPGKYQYDIVMRTDQGTSKILEGLLFLLPTISRVPQND
jgi:hypothetical protein